MKTDKIDGLFNKHSCNYKVDGSSNDTRLVPIEEFISAINQTELEWYKKLESKLNGLWSAESMLNEFVNYRNEIREKIKELEKWKD